MERGIIKRILSVVHRIVREYTSMYEGLKTIKMSRPTFYPKKNHPKIRVVAMLTGPQPKETHQRAKFTLDFFFFYFAKSRKITKIGRFPYGPTGPSLWLSLFSYIFDQIS